MSAHRGVFGEFIAFQPAQLDRPGCRNSLADGSGRFASRDIGSEFDEIDQDKVDVDIDAIKPRFRNALTVFCDLFTGQRHWCSGSPSNPQGARSIFLVIITCSSKSKSQTTSKRLKANGRRLRAKIQRKATPELTNHMSVRNACLPRVPGAPPAATGSKAGSRVLPPFFPLPRTGSLGYGPGWVEGNMAFY